MGRWEDGGRKVDLPYKKMRDEHREGLRSCILTNDTCYESNSTVLVSPFLTYEKVAGHGQLSIKVLYTTCRDHESNQKDHPILAIMRRRRRKRDEGCKGR